MMLLASQHRQSSQSHLIVPCLDDVHWVNETGSKGGQAAARFVPRSVYATRAAFGFPATSPSGTDWDLVREAENGCKGTSQVASVQTRDSIPGMLRGLEGRRPDILVSLLFIGRTITARACGLLRAQRASSGVATSAYC